MATGVKKFESRLLSHPTIGLDTMCFIYQFAQDARYSPLTHRMFELVEQKKVAAVTSVVSVIETLVLPQQRNDQMLVTEYEKMFQNFPGLSVISVDFTMSKLASKIRARYPNIRIPDAIQLSAALLKNCSLFITNDDQLRQVKEIQVVLLKNYC